MAKAMFSTTLARDYQIRNRVPLYFIISLPTNQYECLSSVEN